MRKVNIVTIFMIIITFQKIISVESTPAPPSEGESFNKTCSCKMDMSEWIKEVEDWENEWGSGPVVAGRKEPSNRIGPLFFLLCVLPQLTTVITNIQNLLTALGIGRSLPVNNRIDELAEKLQTASNILWFYVTAVPRLITFLQMTALMEL